jgi:hypothetical protein
MATATALTRAARQLSIVEGRRMLRHPAYASAVLYGAVYAGETILAGGGGPAANAAYAVVLLSFLLVYAPITLVAANRVAAATYRRRVRDPLDGTPVDDRQRTAAAILGLLRGPVLVGLALAVVVSVLGAFTTSATADRLVAVYPRTPLDYLQLPALVLGAGLLGIAVARWLPRPGVLPLVAIMLVVGFLALYQEVRTDVVRGRAWLELWPVWVMSPKGLLPRQPLGQEMWHLAYLLGLGALAGVAGLLRTNGPRRAPWAAAAVTAAVTAPASWQQLG